MTFSELGLTEQLVKAVNTQKYTSPYPVQQEAIPVILDGKDILGIAKTGSGKTAAFVLPILQILNQNSAKAHTINCLVLVPTRELAVQVAEVFKTFGSGLPRKIKAIAIYGGANANVQISELQGAEIVVATPGRLLDLVNEGALKLSEIKLLVLDEADKMLNLGFEKEMNNVFDLLPSQRQTLLFSATLKESIKSIKNNILKNPVLIEVKNENNENTDLITQVAYHVHPDSKGVFLRYLIKTENMQQVLVFVSSVKKADNVTVKLNKNGINAVAFHSQKTQGQRIDALNQFKAGKIRVLVATDLASRGIDIKFLPYVINYELPRSPLDYVHRIGRTGRAESPGKAISLISPEDQHHFKIIQKKMGKKVTILETNELDLKGF